MKYKGEINILRELLDKREEGYKVTEKQLEKLQFEEGADFSPGAKVDIYWENYDPDESDFIDSGYLFGLEFTHFDENEAVIHVTSSDFPEEFDPEWTDLNYLLTIDRVKKIIIKK